MSRYILASLGMMGRSAARIAEQAFRANQPKHWRWQARSKIRGHVVYDGPSALDGRRILGILTYKSGNRKNPGMVQLWILFADVSPIEAVRLGLDVSICGTCVHRRTRLVLPKLKPKRRGSKPRKRRKTHRRTCYVDLGKGPTSVWKAWKRGRYDSARLREVAPFLLGRKLRFGAYGDPAALPYNLLEGLAAAVATLDPQGRTVPQHTGYTHQWREGFALQQLLMASAESDADALEARSLGFSAFQVTAGLRPRVSGTADCPASAEKGHKLTCGECMMCHGAPAATAGRAPRLITIRIPSHGPSGKLAVSHGVVE